MDYNTLTYKEKSELKRVLLNQGLLMKTITWEDITTQKYRPIISFTSDNLSPKDTTPQKKEGEQTRPKELLVEESSIQDTTHTKNPLQGTEPLPPSEIQKDLLPPSVLNDVEGQNNTSKDTQPKQKEPQNPATPTKSSSLNDNNISSSNSPTSKYIIITALIIVVGLSTIYLKKFVSSKKLKGRGSRKTNNALT